MRAFFFAQIGRPMTPANVELLYAHSKECGSHEFVLQQADGQKLYCCLKCKAQVTKEADTEAPKQDVVVPETRKAA